MTPYEVAMLATTLCKLDQDWRSNLPLHTQMEPEDFLDEALDLLDAAELRIALAKETDEYLGKIS